MIRFLTASFGGYLFTSLFTISLSILLPFSNKAESVLLASMLSFIFWLIFILYVYSNININKLLLQFLFTCISLFLLNNFLSILKGY